MHGTIRFPATPRPLATPEFWKRWPAGGRVGGSNPGSGTSERPALRYRSRVRHIAVGRANKGRRVVLLVADRDVRLLSTEGEILRQPELDSSRKYQPLG